MWVKFEKSRTNGHETYVRLISEQRREKKKTVPYRNIDTSGDCENQTQTQSDRSVSFGRLLKSARGVRNV